MDLQKILNGQEGLWTPSAEIPLLNLSELFKGKRTDTLDRYSQNKLAETVLEQLHEEDEIDELNEDSKTALTLYSGTANLGDFYNNTDINDFSFPSWVYAGIYKSLEELGAINRSILFHNPGVGRMIGMLPDNMRRGFKNKEFEITVITEQENFSDKICRLLYPSAKFYYSDENVIINNLNIGITGYNTVIKKKHDCIISQMPLESNLGELSNALEDGGFLLLLTDPTFNEGDKYLNTRKLLSAKLDIIGLMRLPAQSMIENSGYDHAFDITIFRKQSKVDGIHSAIMLNTPAHYADQIRGFEEGQLTSGKKRLEEMCYSNEMYKQIYTLASQANVHENHMAIYLRRLLIREKMTESWVMVHAREIPARELDGKKSFDKIMGLMKIQMQEIVDKDDYLASDIRSLVNYGSNGNVNHKIYENVVARFTEARLRDCENNGEKIKQTVKGKALWSAIANIFDGKPRGAGSYHSVFHLLRIFSDNVEHSLAQSQFDIFFYKNKWFTEDKTIHGDCDIYHTPELGFYYVPVQKVDFLVEARNFKKYLWEYQPEQQIKRDDKILYLERDNVSVGSIIIHEGMLLKKLRMDTAVMESMAYNATAKLFGVDVANRVRSFSMKYTLGSIYDEAKNWSSKSDEFFGDAENQMFGIAQHALKDREEKEILELSGELQSIFYLGEKNRYEDITTTAKTDKDYEKLLSRIRFIDEMIIVRDDINNNIDTEDNRKKLLSLYESFLKSGKLKKISDDLIIKKYFNVEKDEAKSDDRWFIIKSFDKAYHKKTGIFSEELPFDPDTIYFSALDYLNAAKLKSDYRVRVNVKHLLEQGKKHLGTGLYPSAFIDMDNRKEFIRDATATGEWIIDVDNIFEGEYLIRSEKYVFGNIGKKLKKMRAFESYCKREAIDTDLINLDLIISDLQNKILNIPNIPEPIIELDPHMHIIDFDKHVLEFLQLAFGAQKLIRTDFKMDRSENEGFGRWKYYGRFTDAEIPGWALKAVPMSRKMIMRWFNLEAEEKIDRDKEGKEVFLRNGKVKMVNDVELTSERNEFLRNKYNTFIKDTLNADVRRELFELYNESYQIYVPAFSDEPMDIPGITKVFHGKPFSMNSFQNRFVRRFSIMHRLYANHVVGSGKTVSCLVAGWMAKKNGLINKPMYVVLLKNISQWEQHIKELFPTAKYLVVDSSNKRNSLAEIAVNDYDFIVIADSTFGDAIDVSAKRRAESAKKDLEQYFEVKEYLEVEYAGNYANRTIIKPQLKLITKYINTELMRIETLLERSKNDFIEMSFDKLGVDALFVDESDVYKNVDTGMDSYLQKVKGIRRVSSGIATTMRLVSEYIQNKYNYCNRIDMTGTPVSNSATEIYQTLNSITPDLLIDAGMHTFNDFIAAHGRVEPQEVVNTQNQIETKATFVGMRNVNQIKRLINACFDVLTQSSMNEIKRAQGDPIPTPIFNNMVYPSTPEKILMNHYSQYQVWVMKELAKQDPVEKKARTDRKNKIKNEIKQKEAAVKAKERLSIDMKDIEELKASIDTLETERRVLSFNGGVLYNQIRSGIVHTKLYNEFIDDSAREHSKLNKVVQEAVKSFLAEDYTGYDKIEQIEGKDFYIMPDGERRCVKNGQLFFMDRMSRTDIEGFNARDEYIKAIKAAIPDEATGGVSKDKLFMCIDATSSELIDIKRAKKILSEYFGGVNKHFQKSVQYFEHFSGVDQVSEEFELEVALVKVKKVKKITFRDIVQYLYNEGYVRFVFGSTDSMGIGLNLQKTTTDEHHIDMPFRPRDWEQRIGRGLRQGNYNTYMKIHSYSSEGGSETVMQQLLRIKENFIQHIFDLRLLDDFTAEASINGLNTGDVEEQSIFLNQLDSMIHATNDKRIQNFVDQRKELESLLNQQKMFRAVLNNHESNLHRLEKQQDEIDKNTEMYMWLEFEILPLIVEKEAELDEIEAEHKIAVKEMKESEEYKTAIQHVETKYAEMLKYVNEERQKNRIEYQKELDLTSVKSRILPERRKLKDFDLQTKLMMCRKFDYAMSFNREIAEIFFNCYEEGAVINYNKRGKIDRYMHFDWRAIETGDIKPHQIKQLDFIETWGMGNNFYYLGQLSRAIRSKISLIGRVMDGEMMACETFRATLNNKDYIDTVNKADAAINTTNEGEGIERLIQVKYDKVRENQGAYYDFIMKQESISEYAAYVVSELKQLDTLVDRMIMVDEFVDTKKRYESGELEELPTPEDFVDEKLLVI